MHDVPELDPVINDEFVLSGPQDPSKNTPLLFSRVSVFRKKISMIAEISTNHHGTVSHCSRTV